MSNTPFRIQPPGENVTQPVSTESVLHKRIDQLDQKIDAGFSAFRQDMDILLEEAKVNSKWRGDMEQWRSKTSDAVKGESKTNLDQDGAIAQVLIKVGEIEKKTDVQTAMLTKAGSFFKDPKVIALALFVYSLIKTFAHKQGVELP